MLAVHQHHLDVLDRKTRQRAFGECLTDAFLDCGQEIGRNSTALYLVAQFDATAARQRFDPQGHLAELARTNWPEPPLCFLWR